MTVALLSRPDAADGCDAEPCSTCPAREASFCRAVPHASLRRLAGEASIRRYDPGEAVIRDGDDASHVVNITSGSVKLYKQMSDGRRSVVGFLYRGDFAGLITQGRYSFGVEALEPVQACRFPRASFRRLIADLPTLEAELLGRVTHDLEVAQEQMLLLGRKSAVERLSSFILQTAERQPVAADGLIHIRFPMTRADIADYLGLTTETVSRTFTRLKTSHVIRLEALNGAALLDRRRLEQVAAGGSPASPRR